MSDPETNPRTHQLSEFKTETLAERIAQTDKVKKLMAKMREIKPDAVYPKDEVFDYFNNHTPELSNPVIFDFVVTGGEPVAVAIGIERDERLDLRWLFSAEPGAGIEILKNLMAKYAEIKLKASPYGYTKANQEILMAKLVKYYHDLGFTETTDHQDGEYGGTVPMEWHK